MEVVLKDLAIDKGGRKGGLSRASSGIGVPCIRKECWLLLDCLCAIGTLVQWHQWLAVL